MLMRRYANYVLFFNAALRTSTVTPAWLPPGVHALPITSIICALPMVMFAIFESHWYWNHVSPALVIIFVWCWCIMAINGIRAALSDAGILPFNIHDTDASRTGREGLPEEYTRWIDLPGPHSGTINTISTMKYCDTCRIWRPIRCAHCSKCGVCVSVMDHHCPWLGNCIGWRNYWYFFIFLTGSVVVCIWLLVMSVYKMSHTGVNHHFGWCSLLLAIYAMVCLPYAALLWIFHVILAITGGTTREYFARRGDSQSNAKVWVCGSDYADGMSDGVIANVARTWWHGRGGRNIDLRHGSSPRTIGDVRYKQVRVGALSV